MIIMLYLSKFEIANKILYSPRCSNEFMHFGFHNTLLDRQKQMHHLRCSEFCKKFCKK